MDSVTLHRMVQRVLQKLALEKPVAAGTGGWLAVDSTTVRVSGSEKKLYSGYKHHKGLKVQVLAGLDGRIHDVSPAVAASVHDKTLWNRRYRTLKHAIKGLVLADKAYAGAEGEGSGLVRPVKRGERAYCPETKDGNRALSRLRVRIEHVMASLKRFRILRDTFSLEHGQFDAVVTTIARIHNLEKGFDA